LENTANIMQISPNSKLYSILAAFSLLLAVYNLFSFGLTDPNLVLSQWQPYWEFQQYMWQMLFHNRPIMATLFATVVLLMFAAYFWLLHALYRNWHGVAVTRRHIGIWLLIIIPLLGSYNALSHDVFNYMFNAKMVVEYQADPHQQAALSFSEDEWVRFMHNTHTPAPYGYGWTGLSLVPAVLGNGVFSVTWLLFRLWAVASMFLLFYGLQRLSKGIRRRPMTVLESASLFMNPLVLIEIIGNQHNDFWMMAPAVIALALILERRPMGELRTFTQRLTQWLAIGMLAAVSVTVKYATLALLPLVSAILGVRALVPLLLRKRISWLPYSEKLEHWLIAWIESFWITSVPLAASLLLFVPLLTSRSQFFHPWYLTWSLAFLPFIKQGWWRMALFTLSVSSMMRYIPWMVADGYTAQVILWQRLITWIPFAAVTVYMLYRKIRPPKQSADTVRLV
jgi:hypothetical protein